LRGFHSCAALVGYAQAHASQTQGQRTPVVQPLVQGEAPQTAAPAPTADAVAGTDYSTTNNQEVGVDEPDIVKTDGNTLFTVAGDTVYAIAAHGDARILGSLKLGDYGGQLFLRGHRLVAITQKGYLYPLALRVAAPLPYPGVAKTQLTEIDVSDPSNLKVLRTLAFDGSFADARQNGGTIRVVVNSQPQAPRWLPRSHFVSNVTGKRRTRNFVPCNRVSRPPVFSGLGMLSIVTLNLDKGLWQEDSDGVMTDAQTVYGSTKHLFVATQRWITPDTPAADLPQSATTLISRFDVSDPDSTTYEGSGSVPGYLLNQYSLSEQDGDLRAATTTEPIWFNGAQALPSQSMVTVLRGPALTKVGQVSGLGHGQRIYSVRFIGDVGYVVTFRQIDPLYVIDLSDPANPRVRGQLELPGYSAYLHPVGSGRLLGIGGGQASLFDVSDPAAPKLLDRMDTGFSQVDYDPHAFLWWPARKLALLPAQNGIVGLRVASGLAKAGTIDHAAAQRSVVVGDRVYTVAGDGVLASDLVSLAKLSFVAFPQPATGGPGGPPTGPPQPVAQAAR
jgi:uncharacterized secreted protein with C-terminal beta-propeller domain